VSNPLHRSRNIESRGFLRNSVIKGKNH